MGTRLELHDRLRAVTGLNNVYFQPPETIKLQYPCVIYSLSNVQIKHADDAVYNHKSRYSVTIVTKDPDSDIPFKMLGFPYCSFERAFTSNNLHHTIFDIYF